MRDYIKNNRGVALTVALVVALLSMLITTSTIYMVIESTKISGIEKRYKTALGAAKGAARLMAEDVIATGGDSKLAKDGNVLNAPACFQNKLELNTSEWSDCTQAQKSADPKVSPDVVFQLGNYRVYMKIIDSSEGNTSFGLLPDVRGVVAPYSSIKPPLMPRSYYIEIFVQNVNDSTDTAEVAVLYAY